MRIDESERSDRIKRLRKKAMALPLKPGVYIMHDNKGKIIYIGKAKALKNRVSQYFGSETNHTEKVRQMVANVNDFEYIICGSEFEALILECSLIKQNMPKYNILLKDDKGYHYIKITNGRFRTIKSALQIDDDGAKYLGPYSSGFVVKKNVEEAQNIFKLPHCSKEFIGEKMAKRPCLNYHLGACLAPCAGKIKLADYEKTVDEAIDFLQGGSKLNIKQLKDEMEKAAERLDFECAARLRDRIRALQKISEKQKVIFCTYDSQDVIASVESGGKVCVEIFSFRNAMLSDRKQYIVDNSGLDNSQFKSSFLKQYYVTKDVIPKRIVLDEPCEDMELLAQMFSEILGTKTEIVVPKIGEQQKLVDMCRENAYEYLTEVTGKAGHVKAALEELSKLLSLKDAPHYIESYDISHLMGTDNVAGMVVFRDGLPYKKGYRKFKIKSFVGQDDCRSMSEVVLRRFTEYKNAVDKTEGFGILPDLILLDGGIAQINAVKAVLSSLDIDVKVFGMVKDGKHKTNAIASDGGIITLKSNRAAYTLVSNIQEEVHRFAIGYHRNKATSTMLYSELTAIPGVAKLTAEKLLKHFKTINAIKTATVNEICQIKGMSEKTAKNIYTYFNTEE